MSTILSDASVLIGRLHPLLVHLPIGFLVLLVGLELLACWPGYRHLRAARGVVLGLTVPAILLSALCGWLLGSSGGYDVSLLEWHRWAGLGVAGAIFVVLVLHWLDWRVGYGVGLGVACCGLVVAGHFEGSLTHGSDYLTRFVLPLHGSPAGGQVAGGKRAGDGPVKAGAGMGEVPGVVGDSAFATLVMPVIEEKCVSCHGLAKAKAGLRVDTLEELLKTRRRGAVVQPGKAAASKLITVLRLPVDNAVHMPPRGRLQLTASEITLLEWWIDAGAPGDKTAAELNLPVGLQKLMTAQRP